MYLLDTNICVAITNANDAAMRSFGQKRNNCALPIIVVSELYKGAYCSGKTDSNLTVLNKLLKMLLVVEFDTDAAEEFGRIQSELKMIGRPTGDMDALMGAIARTHSSTLVTRNTRDF